MSTTIITDEMQAALTAQIESDLKSIGSNIDNLLAERDALRAVLREISKAWEEDEIGQIDGELIDRAKEMCK